MVYMEAAVRQSGIEELAERLQRRMAVRNRELTPAQRKAVMYAHQQIIMAHEAKLLKEEREAEAQRLWLQEQAEDEMLDKETTTTTIQTAPVVREVSLREAIGHVMRELRVENHYTLREVSEMAGVSLGYLSEVERGQKEASSHFLSSISRALGLTVADMLRRVAGYLDKVSV